MTQTSKALSLAAAMIAIALLAVFEIVPQEVAQYSPFLLLALFPGAWLGRRCTYPAVSGKAR